MLWEIFLKNQKNSQETQQTALNKTFLNQQPLSQKCVYWAPKTAAHFAENKKNHQKFL